MGPWGLFAMNAVQGRWAKQLHGGGGQGRDGNVTGSSVVPFDRFQHMYEYCVRGSNPILLKLNII